MKDNFSNDNTIEQTGSPSEDDLHLISQIKKGGNAREEALKTIYTDKKLRNSFFKFLTDKGCREVVAEDIFQESVLTMDQKVRSNEFQNKSSLSTYIMGIGKFKWFNEYRKTKNITTTNYFGNLVDIESPEWHMVNDQRQDVLKEVLNPLKEKCREILLLFAYGFKSSEIAEVTGASDTRSVVQSKYRCLQSMKKVLEENNEILRILKESYEFN